MNNRHWNTVYLDDSLRDKDVFSVIDDSYNLVIQALSRSGRPILC
ncbi:MAG TPA: hypothetical protein VJ974_08790 [Geopsychrobacteraceae bacterium]|nr:hypothetical protein [Geopsychrobacteraceae bacterium]